MKIFKWLRSICINPVVKKETVNPVVKSIEIKSTTSNQFSSTGLKTELKDYMNSKMKKFQPLIDKELKIELWRYNSSEISKYSGRSGFREEELSKLVISDDMIKETVEESLKLYSDIPKTNINVISPAHFQILDTWANFKTGLSVTLPLTYTFLPVFEAVRNAYSKDTKYQSHYNNSIALFNKNHYPNRHIEFKDEFLKCVDADAKSKNNVLALGSLIQYKTIHNVKNLAIKWGVKILPNQAGTRSDFIAESSTGTYVVDVKVFPVAVNSITQNGMTISSLVHDPQTGDYLLNWRTLVPKIIADIELTQKVLSGNAASSKKSCRLLYYGTDARLGPGTLQKMDAVTDVINKEIIPELIKPLNCKSHELWKVGFIAVGVLGPEASLYERFNKNMLIKTGLISDEILKLNITEK